VTAFRPVAWLVALALPSSACTSDGGGGAKLHTIASIHDGDTFTLEDDTVIRMLGIDTPERPPEPEECYGDEALNHLASMIGDQKVKLEYDVERQDDFGRTLAWVRTEDGTFLNAKQVEDGFACVLIIPPNGAEYETYLETLESGAQAALRGLWGACGGCNTPAFAGARGP
jgi:micrococcal nuclease